MSSVTETSTSALGKQGEMMIISPQFDEASGFSEGLALVKVGKKLGYIEKTGKYVWAPTKWKLNSC